MPRTRIKAAEPIDLFIYGDIGDSWWDDEAVTASGVRDALRQIPKGTPINLRINSGGGDVGEGLAIYNLLKERRQQITTYIDGYALSAASFIALAGSKIISPEASIWMIHNPHTIAWGDANAMRKTADALDTHRDAILSIYAERTGKSEEEIIAALDAETWFTGIEAKEFGLADEVTDQEPIANRLPNRFVASADREKLAHLGWQFSDRPSLNSVRGRVAASYKPSTGEIPPMTEEINYQAKFEAASSEISDLKAQLTEFTAVKADRDALAAQVETLTAENSDLKQRQTIADRYSSLRQQAESLIAQGKMPKAQFDRRFSDDQKGDVDKLVADPRCEYRLFAIEEAIEDAKASTPTLPLNSHSREADAGAIGQLGEVENEKVKAAEEARARAASRYESAWKR